MAKKQKLKTAKGSPKTSDLATTITKGLSTATAAPSRQAMGKTFNSILAGTTSAQQSYAKGHPHSYAASAAKLSDKGSPSQAASKSYSGMTAVNATGGTQDRTASTPKRTDLYHAILEHSPEHNAAVAHPVSYLGALRAAKPRRRRRAMPAY